MSLFIGNLSPEATKSDLEKMFGEYGECYIKFKGRYGFAVFDNEKDADNALRSLKGTMLHDKPINVEPCKGDRRYDDRPYYRSRPSYYSFRGRCYICGHHGHYARDCPRADKSRSRSGSHRKYSRRHRRSSDYSGHRRRKSSSSSSRSSYSSNSSRSRSYRKRSSSDSNYSRSRSRSRSKSDHKRRNRSRSRNESEESKSHEKRSNSSVSEKKEESKNNNENSEQLKE